MKRLIETYVTVALVLILGGLAHAVPLNEPPVAVCQDVTVEAGPGCEADAGVDGGSYDPDGDPITLTQNPLGPYPLGATLVTLTVTDDKGASDTCEATVTVLDTTPPVAVCQDVTVEAGPGGYADADVDGGSYDPSGCPVIIVQDPPGPYPLGETEVTLTVTDSSGNTDSCTATVRVLPTIAVDIKPGSCPNAFNSKGKGVIPVAIAGSADVDVTEIDVTTIVLTTPSGNVVLPLDWGYDDSTQPVYDPACENCFDAEDPTNFNCDLDGDGNNDAYCGDGYPDLILKFDGQELATAIAPVTRGDCLRLVVTATKLDGTVIVGSDFLVIRTK